MTVPPWTQLTGWSKNRLLQSSTALLVFVSLVAMAVEAVNTTGAAARVPPTLKLAFGASLLCLLAGVLYAVKCPPLLKKHETINRYIEDELKLLMHLNPDQRPQVVMTHLEEAAGAGVATTLAALEAKRASKTISAAETKELNRLTQRYYLPAAQTYLSKEWDRLDVSLTLVRAAVTLLWLVGGAITVFLLIKRALVVFRN